jgi:hypothetical protein
VTFTFTFTLTAGFIKAAV